MASRTIHANQRGISLIEILVVLAIIALISSGVAIVALEAWDRAQYKRARQDITQLSTAVKMYQLEHGRHPNAIVDMVGAGMIESQRPDPWGSDYAFACPGEHAEFDIASAGKDRELGNDDDVNSWELDQPK